MKETIKTTSSSLGTQCCTVSSRARGRSGRRAPGSHAGSDEAERGRQAGEQGWTARREALVGIPMNTSHGLWSATET